MAKDDIDDILMELKKDILRVSDSKVSSEIVEVYEEEVDFAYDEFTPRSYRRRYKDNYGFADQRNWDIEQELSNDGVSITLINEAKPINSPMRLDTIIEEGIYDWTGSNPPPRPVYERTNDRLAMEEVVENILESELKKLGWDVYN